MEFRGWQTHIIDATWDVAEGPTGLQRALDRVSAEAEAAVDEGFQFIVLSDRAAGEWGLPVAMGDASQNPEIKESDQMNRGQKQCTRGQQRSLQGPLGFNLQCWLYCQHGRCCRCSA